MKQLGVSASEMVAFVGTTFWKPEVMTYMRSRGISCISVIIWNLNKKAEVNSNGLYLDLVMADLRFISIDRPKTLAQQLELYI